MKSGKVYSVTKRIKIHTSPLAEVDVVKQGKFVKETSSCYIFDTFRVNKSNVISIDEMNG